MRSTVLVGYALAVGLGTGCGESSSGESDGGTGPDGGGSGVDSGADELAGSITVLDNGGLGTATLGAAVFGDFPEGGPPVWHAEVVQEGACRLLRYQPGFCQECDGVCLAPEECRPWPRFRSAGVLSVEGLATPDPITLEPTFGGRYQTSGGLPDPLFDPDATVTITATGGEIAGFELATPAVARLSLPAFDAGSVADLPGRGQVTLEWPEADPDSRVLLTVHSGGAFHGIPPEVLLECDAADQGQLTIPAAVMAELPALGLGCAKMHDCAALGILRYRRVTAGAGADRVSLMVASGVNYPVTHDVR